MSYQQDLYILQSQLETIFKQKTHDLAKRETLRFEYVTAFKTRFELATNLAMNTAVQSGDSASIDLIKKVVSALKASIPMADMNGQAILPVSVMTYGFTFGNPQGTPGANASLNWVLGGNINLSFLSPMDDWFSKPLAGSNTGYGINSSMIASGLMPQYLVDNWALSFLVNPSIQSFSNWAGVLGAYDQNTINTVFGLLNPVFPILQLGKSIYSDFISATFKVLKDQYDLNMVESQIFDLIADNVSMNGRAQMALGATPLGGFVRTRKGAPGQMGFTTIRSPMGPQIVSTPLIPSPLAKLNTAAEAAQALYESGLFTNIVDYLAVGDEPQPTGGEDTKGLVYTGVIDLKSMMKADQLDALKKFFVILPRKFLRGWFDDQIVPSLSKDANGEPIYEEMFWGAFINLFNEANLASVQASGYSPWDWETKKLDTMMMVNSQSDLDTLKKQMTDYSVTSKLDPRNAQLLRDYRKLPRLGDMGLEITRQNAINELLKLGEYDTVQAILDSYNYAHSNSVMHSALTSPVPFNIVDKSGKQVSKSTNLTT